MERYIYLDNKIIVFIITNLNIEENIKQNEKNPYKIYNIISSTFFTKIIRIYDINTNEEYKKYGSLDKKYILGQSLKDNLFYYLYNYYLTIESIYNHNYEKIYKDKNISGEYKKYNEEGELVEEYYHNNFIKEGEYKRYEYSKLKESTFYINNLKNGISIIYNSDGLIEKKMNYNNNLKEGDEEIYFYNDDIVCNKKINTYENNKIIKEFNINNKGESNMFNYINGCKDGSYSKIYLKNNIWIEEDGSFLKGDIINCIKKIKDSKKIIYDKKTENNSVKTLEYEYNDTYYLKSELVYFNKNNIYKEIYKGYIKDEKNNIVINKYKYFLKQNNYTIININFDNIQSIQKNEINQLIEELNIEFNST